MPSTPGPSIPDTFGHPPSPPDAETYLRLHHPIPLSSSPGMLSSRLENGSSPPRPRKIDTFPLNGGHPPPGIHHTLLSAISSASTSAHPTPPSSASASGTPAFDRPHHSTPHPPEQSAHFGISTSISSQTGGVLLHHHLVGAMATTTSTPTATPPPPAQHAAPTLTAPLLRRQSWLGKTGDPAMGINLPVGGTCTEERTPTFALATPTSPDGPLNRMAHRRESLCQLSRTSTGSLHLLPSETRTSPLAAVSANPSHGATPLREDWPSRPGETRSFSRQYAIIDAIRSDDHSSAPLWRARDTLRGGLVLLTVLYFPHPEDHLSLDPPSIATSTSTSFSAHPSASLLPTAILMSQQLGHIRGVLPPLDCYCSGDDWVIVYPWFGELWGALPHRGITLMDMLNVHGGTLPESTIRFILRELVSTLSAIHAAGFSYGALYPQNILVDAQLRVKIIDFHHTLPFPPVDPSLQETSTRPDVLTKPSVHPGWSALTSPEFVPSSAPSDMSTEPEAALNDAWDLGILLFRMLEGTHPWGSVVQARRSGWSLHCLVGSTCAREAVEGLLNPSPRARWTIGRLRDSKWLSEALGIP